MDGWRLDRIGETGDDGDRRFDSMPVYGTDDDVDAEPAHLRVRRAQIIEQTSEQESPSEGRRHGWLRWVVGGVAMVMFLSAGLVVWQVYRSTATVQQAEIPFLRADTSPIRVEPTDPGGLEVPHQNRLVLEGAAPPGGAVDGDDAEELAASVPEEPMTDVIAAMRDGIGGPEIAELVPDASGDTAVADGSLPPPDVADDLRAAMEALILRGGSDVTVEEAPATDDEGATDLLAAPNDQADRPEPPIDLEAVADGAATRVVGPPGVDWAEEPDFRDRVEIASLVQPPTRVIARPLVGRSTEARPVGHRREGLMGGLAVLGEDLPVRTAVAAPAPPAAPDQTASVETEVGQPEETIALPDANPVVEADEPAAPATDLVLDDPTPAAPLPPRAPTPPPAADGTDVAAAEAASPVVPEPAEVPSAPVEPSHGVQVVAVPSELEAATEWARFQDRFPELLAERRLTVRRIDLGDRGVWYRVLAGSVSRGDADTLCAALRARGSDCIVRDL